jgi:ATPase subunit of ABC transporter with duplicated ATPase domains
LRDDEAWRVDVVLGSLGFPYEFHDRTLDALSGGWQRLALIARASIAEPDLLLLDEPTNHLDLAKILHLERWLATEVRGPFVIVSHDREVLDRCTNRTLFLRDAHLHDFAAPYTQARRLLTEHDLAAAKAREAEEAEVKRLERSAKRLASWGKVFDNEKFSKRARSMEKRIEKMKDDMTEVAAEDRRNLELADGGVQSNILLRCNNLDIAAPDGNKLFSIAGLALARGDRAVILGVNGSGKSTFLRHLVGEYADHGDRIALTAPVYFNPQVEAGYFDQDLSRLPGDQPMFRFFARTFAAPDARVRAELVRAGFPFIEHERQIKSLSGGERARLLFLLLKFEQPNLLILDEPTNHLDVDGRERLEDEILTRELTAVMVSHDRRFVDDVANRFFVIEKGRLIETTSAQPFYESLLED